MVLFRIRNAAKLVLLVAVWIALAVMDFGLPESREWGDLPRLETGELLVYPELVRAVMPKEWGIMQMPQREGESRDENPAESFGLIIGETTIREATVEKMTKNRDVIGWIFIPETLVNYPILYRESDADFYLTHDESGEEAQAGAIYLDAAMGGEFGDVTLLHGHSMNDNSMFGDLLGYKDSEWAEKRETVFVYGGGELREYEVFASVLINADNENLTVGFRSEVERKLYFERMIDRSELGQVGGVDFSDVLIMNTCSYESDNARLLVFAQLTRIDGRRA